MAWRGHGLLRRNISAKARPSDMRSWLSRLSSSPTLLGRDPLSTVSRLLCATAPPAAARRSALRRPRYSPPGQGALAAGAASNTPERLAWAVRLLEALHGGAARHPLALVAARSCPLARNGCPHACSGHPLEWRTVGGEPNTNANSNLAPSPFSPAPAATPTSQGRRTAFGGNSSGGTSSAPFGHSQTRTLQVWDCGCGGWGSRTNFLTKSHCIACQRPAPLGAHGSPATWSASAGRTAAGVECRPGPSGVPTPFDNKTATSAAAVRKPSGRPSSAAITREGRNFRRRQQRRRRPAAPAGRSRDARAR